MLKIETFCTIPSGAPFPPSYVYSYTHFALIYSIHIWLIVPSLSPHNQHLFCCVLSIPAQTYLVRVSLFSAAIRRDSVSLLNFYLLCPVLVFSYAISLVCRLKYSYICFSSHFRFQVILFLWNYAMSVLFLATVISRSPCFLYRYINVIRNAVKSSSSFSWHVQYVYLISGM